MTALATCAVGDQLPVLHRDIDLATLVRYAGASGDFNPIHFDETYARAAGLDGVIGHGMLAMGLVSTAVTDWLGDSGQLVGLTGRFVGSFRLGDRLTVTGEIVERDGARVVVRLCCVNDAGTEIIGNASATASIS